MCGIAGFVSQEKNKKKILKAMCDRIIHRGPDGEGYYTDENVALGHRRLAIIDLDLGSQPMFNEDQNIIVVFNGEIYNYIELRAQLKKRGHKFATNSDTEVLVHGYEEWQEELPTKLRGMFAFVIWDKKNKKLFGARDHFGIKPLYYTQIGDTLLFASEIKSFLEYPTFKKELNKEILGPYLSFNYVPTAETFFKGVYRLDPGYSLTYQEGKLSINQYFKLTFDPQERDFATIVGEISQVMEDSVNKHMLSDVEVGSFLSSGIDSSYIVSLAKPDNTYTIGYDIPKYNEADYAKDLTQKLGIKNKSKKINKDEYLKVIPKIMYHMDEPLADASAVALYFVSKLAAKDVKVVLSGEGADELFGGYNTYRESVDYNFYNKIPFVIRKIISKICSIFPEHRGINFLVRRGQSLEESYIGVNKVFSEKEAKKVLNIPVKIKNKDLTKKYFAEQKNQDEIIQRQAIDINFWLIKDIFAKADRMTMANSLEGRVPFTDIEVFKVARSLPKNAKVTKENTKVALREAAHKVIPNESYKKKKLGFPVPLREWMREETYYKEIKAKFNSDIAKELFNNARIIKLLDDHYHNKCDNYKKIWTIYCFIIWYQVFFEEA